jgi:hypothetical protein
MASRGKHTRSTPQLPLAPPKADPEKIIRKENSSEGGTSTAKTGIFGDFHDFVETPTSSFHHVLLSSVRVSRSLNFGSVPAGFSPLGLKLVGETLVTPLSPKVVPWFRPNASEYSPTPSFTTPPPIITVVEGREIYVPWNSQACSPDLLQFPSHSVSSAPIFPLQASFPPSSPTPIVPMAGANPPLNRMDSIVAARYSPLILPQPVNPLPTGDYLKYMPKFTREEDITTEENLVDFYSYADNLNIENEDVWMRVFVQSLDGEVRKWFRRLAPRSIVGIEALDSAFLRQWGDKKDFMYYMTEFGYLKKMEGESVSDFSKRFNKMYNKIPAEINPTEASAKISYASAFNPDLFLLLRERRATSLDQMQDVAIEVESNVLAVDRLRNKTDANRIKGRSEASTSGPSVPHPQVDELTKIVKSMSTEMEKMKVEGKQPYRNPQNAKTKEASGGQTILLPRLCKETREEEIVKTRKFRALFKIILWLMRKKRNKWV